jgi:hypothetical protein
MYKQIIIIVAIFLTLIACGDENSANMTKRLSTLSTNQTTKIAFIADQGMNNSTKEVLKLIKDQGTDLLVINGDFEYGDDPKGWAKMHEKILGEDFPIIAVAGNHDECLWKQYQPIIKKWQENPKLKCSGVAGEYSSCEFRGIKIVTTVPGIFRDEKYSKEKSAKFVLKSFRDDESIWRICGFHKNMHAMQTGDKGDESGWGVYEECKNAGAMITTGHEHAYARSYLLDSIENQSVLSDSNDMELKKGQSLVVLSGVGGESVRELKHDSYWWAAKANATNGLKKGGALFCEYGIKSDHRSATCYFMDVDHNIWDRFSLHSSL